MNRFSTRFAIVLVVVLLATTFLIPSSFVAEAQTTGCTSQQLLQADRLLRDAQDALGNGDVTGALKALQDAEAILQGCQSGAVPTRVPTRIVVRTATPAPVTGTTKAFVGTKSGVRFSYPNRTGFLAVDLTSRAVVSNNAGAAVSLLNNDRPRSGEMWVFISVVAGRATNATMGSLLENTIKSSTAYAGKTYTRARTATARSGTLSRVYAYSDLATEDKRIILFPVGTNYIGLMIVNARTSEMSRYVADLNVIIATVSK
ncbi:MAG: hypothetical protein KF716_02240 [Anaerolineae bacterium]|nr:hypothetical protein [Anaerolineae bacterium]